MRIRKIGSLFVLAEWTRGGTKRRITAGPYWHLGLVTASVILFVTLVIYLYVLSGRLVVRVVGLCLGFTAFVFLLLTSLVDPGIAPRHLVPMGKDWTFSEYAQAYRPPGTVYCRISHVFIAKYHHFCPWSGTAIGENNLTYFHALIASLSVSFSYNLIILILFLARDGQ